MHSIFNKALRLKKTLSLLLFINTTPTSTLGAEPPCIGPNCNPLQDSFASLVIDNAGVNQQLIKPFADSFFPELESYVNKYSNANLVKSAKSGKCCKWGNFGVKATAKLQDFFLKSIKQGQITISPIKGKDKISLKVKVKQPTAGFNTVSVSAGFAAGVPINCAINAKASVSISQLSMDLALTLNDSAGKKDSSFTITPDNVKISGVLVGLTPKFNNACSVLASPIVAVFGTLSTSLTNIALPFLQGTISDAVEDIICPKGKCPSFSIPTIPTIKLNDAGTLHIYPDIQDLTTSSVQYEAKGLAHFQATLTKPDWRSGSSLLTPSSPSGSLPTFSDDNIANIFIEDDGVNSFVESIWYLVWATLATDKSAASSDLCSKTEFDACAFPPMLSNITNGTEKAAFDAAFALRGVFSGYQQYVLINPPQISFREDGSIQGSSNTVMKVYSKNFRNKDVLLVTVDATASFSVTTPSYDPETGYFSNLSIFDPNLDVSPPIFPTDIPTQDIITNLVNGAEDQINKVLTTIVPLINKALADALSKFPLKIPEIPNAPLPGTDLHIDLKDPVSIATFLDEKNNGYLNVTTSLLVTTS